MSMIRPRITATDRRARSSMVIRHLPDPVADPRHWDSRAAVRAGLQAWRIALLRVGQHVVPLSGADREAAAVRAGRAGRSGRVGKRDVRQRGAAKLSAEEVL